VLHHFLIAVVVVARVVTVCLLSTGSAVDLSDGLDITVA
jgi:hypothetical protein